MADWFAKLMQQGPARGRAVNEDAAEGASVERRRNPRDPRYDAVVQALRARDVEDRDGREKRHRWYRQSLESDTEAGSGLTSAASPQRLYKFRTKVPCRMTREARSLLEELSKRFAGCTVNLQQVANGQQALLVTAGTGTERKQIGWIEHCVGRDPKLCNVRNQGLSVETNGESMLVLRFRYPSTSVRMSSSCGPADSAGATIEAQTGLDSTRYPTDGAQSVDFAEIRPALDQRSSEKSSSPRLVWLTRPELETINALESRDYESFYVRFKLELQAGIWSSLSTVLANAPNSQWHRGSCVTVVTEPDAALRKIYQRTVDDSGRVVDIGADRTYDAAPATDILLLYLDTDVLADIADIYFTLSSANTSDSYFLKEELFTIIRRFWASSQSLASRYGSDLAAVVRMAQRAIPMPAQTPLLKQDWTNLRQALVDRYGEGGRNAADLVGNNVHRPCIGPLTWPFSSFPAGEVNLGLRLVYRQEWTHLGAQRGEVIRVVPPTNSAEPNSSEHERSRGAETVIEHGDTPSNLSDLVDEVVTATLATMKWGQDFDGAIHTGARALAAMSDTGFESESRESSRELSARLSDMTVRLATEIRGKNSPCPVPRPSPAPGSPSPVSGPPDEPEPTYVYSKLQQRYEILTQPAEIQNVVLVAEQLPTPAEIDLSWVRRHDWIFATVLLDESFREALNTIRDCDRTRDSSESDGLDATRQRFFEHLRANVLHYQRAIWRQEDPQQRSMRYRKSGKKVPLDWRFELEAAGGLTIDELGDRLAATSVDGQFAAYSGGREVDLDQVIDPSGPVGYYGNYAIYHMRPEFGSADSFSMLHFFKSPYLRPNPETGIPEIEVSREHGRRISLDTGGVVIDAIHGATSDGAGASDLATGLVEALEGYELIVDGADGIELLRVSDGDADGLELGIEHVAFSRLRAGRATDGESEQCNILAQDDPALRLCVPNDAEALAEEQIIRTRIGQGHTVAVGAAEPDDSDTELMIIAHSEGEGHTLSLDVRGTRAPQGDAGILDKEESNGIHAGPGHHFGKAPSIQGTDEGALILTPAVSPRPATRDAATDQATADDQSPPEPHTVPAIVASNSEQRIVRAGPTSNSDTEPAIVARNDEKRTLQVGDGRSLDLKADPWTVSTRDDGTVTSLLVGWRPESITERVIQLGDVARVDSIVDGKVHPHEEAVLAGGDDEWVTSLLAGSGLERRHDRVILAQEDEWLRPSLVAG